MYNSALCEGWIGAHHFGSWSVQGLLPPPNFLQPNSWANITIYAMKSKRWKDC